MTVTVEGVACYTEWSGKVTLELESLKDKMSLSSEELGKEQARQRRKCRAFEIREIAGGQE